MNSVALEVRDLIKTFALDGTTINAVDGVSFQVKSGEFVALVGPSGSGKTTLLSILAALLTPTSGQVLIDGQDLAQMNERQRVKLRREKIGFTFQSNNLIPYLTARENVEFMLRLNNKRDRAGRVRSDELLARLGLFDRLHNLPAQMSGGQQQRVAIARALVNDPGILLADEPTGALDSKTGAEIIGLFQTLHKDFGQTVILVTHDPFVARHTERIIRLADGQIVADAPNPTPLKAGTPRPEGED